MEFTRNPVIRLGFAGLLLGAIASTTVPAGTTAAQPASTPATASAPTVSVLPGTFPVSRFASGRAEIRTLVTNSGADDARIWFVPLLTDSNGKALDTVADGLWRDLPVKDIIRAGETVPVTLAVHPPNDSFNAWWDRRLPLRGYINVQTQSTGKVTKLASAPHEISIPQVVPAAAEVLVLFGPLLFAVFSVVSTAPAPDSKLPVGPAKLSGDSLASTVGIGAGLAGALIALTSLPTLTAYATRDTYAFLIAVLAALTALGAPASNLFQRIVQPDSEPDDKSRKKDRTPPSRVPFGVAVFLVLWGALGQLAVGALLLLELHHAHVIATSTFVLLLGIVAAMFFVVVFYVRKVTARPHERAHHPNFEIGEFITAPASTPRGWSVP